VLVTDAQCHRYGNDAAQDCSPVGVDKLLVVGEQQDQFVAATGADSLQVVQDPERALI